MRSLRTSLVLASSLSFVLSASGAAAQEERLRQANALSAHGDHDAAVRVLREAQVETPSARVDVNLAIALGELGHLREARRLLRRVMAGDANPLLVEAAAEHLHRIEGQLATVTVHVEGDAAALRVDAEQAIPVDARTLQVELDPGEHHLELLASGGASVAQATVDLARAERATVRLGRPNPPAIARTDTARAAPHPRERGASGRVPSPEDAAAMATTAPDASAVTATAPTEGDDPLPWILVGSGAAAAVIASVIAIAVVTSQPSATMGDLPPVVVGGP